MYYNETHVIFIAEIVRIQCMHKLCSDVSITSESGGCRNPITFVGLSELRYATKKISNLAILLNGK